MSDSLHIHASAVTKVYDGKEVVQALADVSLDIRHGEFLSVLGPSGCGKSTFLRCIGGLEDTSSGVIEVDGVPVSGPPAELGVVFQRDVLLEWLTVLDNILLPIKFKREKTAGYLERARHLLGLFGLLDFQHSYPWQLSGGMRQRASICRALVDDPKLLLMDEPFGAIDALTRDQLNVELQRMWLDSRKTVVFVTHGITEAVFLADRVAVFSPRPGKIVEVMDIDIPRPRRLSVRDDAKFRGYCSHIRDLFEEMGLLQEV